MIKTILVHLHGDGRDRRLLDLGWAAADLFAAHLECAYVRHPAATQWIIPPPGLLAAGVNGKLLAPVGTDDDRSLRCASSAFRAFCVRTGIAQADSPATSVATAGWREIKGGVDELTRRLRFHDLLIDGRPSTSAGPTLLGRLIAGGGRPVLVSPSGKPFLTPFKPGRTIAIAWKDTLETAKAMSAALPFLSKAERILVLTTPEGGNIPDRGAEGIKDALDWLAWHGLSAEARTVPRTGSSVARAVVTAAMREGADLLVRGAYGHGRSLEFLLGGFTQDVVNACRLPVLMVH